MLPYIKDVDITLEGVAQLNRVIKKLVIKLIKSNEMKVFVYDYIVDLIFTTQKDAFGKKMPKKKVTNEMKKLGLDVEHWLVSTGKSWVPKIKNTRTGIELTPTGVEIYTLLESSLKSRNVKSGLPTDVYQLNKKFKVAYVRKLEFLIKRELSNVNN